MKATIKNYSEGKDFTIDTDDKIGAHDCIEVFDTLEAAMTKVGTGYGPEVVKITKEQLEQIIGGGVLAWDDGEYAHYMIMTK